MALRVLFLAHDLSTNALGRAYALTLLTDELGYEARVAGPASSGRIWEVLEGSAFVERCITTSADDPALLAAAEEADVLVAVKVMPDSLGTGHRLAALTGVPLVVDVDDPDAEVLTDQAWSVLRRPAGPRAVVRSLRELRVLRRLKGQARHLPVTVSNPVLQQMYGGTVIPHVRAPRPTGPRHATNGVLVAFIGTLRAHKGIEVLRGAIAELAPRGYRLGATISPPVDAAPWEEWWGETSIDDGLARLGGADVVAVPSLPGINASAQLPVKVIDAMMAAKPVVASAVPPVEWALGGTGVLVEAGSMASLRDGLASLADASVRTLLGVAARERALAEFTPRVVAPRFAEVLDRVVSGWGWDGASCDG